MVKTWILRVPVNYNVNKIICNSALLQMKKILNAGYMLASRLSLLFDPRYKLCRKARL